MQRRADADKIVARSFALLGLPNRSKGAVSEHIGWCVELAIQPGQFDSFIELTREMVAETAAEPGVLAYQRFHQQ